MSYGIHKLKFIASLSLSLSYFQELELRKQAHAEGWRYCNSGGFRAVPRVPWNPPPLGWIYYYKESIDDRLKVGHLILAI